MSKKNLKINAEPKTEATNRTELEERLAQAQTALKQLQKCDASAAAHAYTLGKELAAISEKKLFKAAEDVEGKRCKSFRKFVEDKLNISEQYAYMLIKAAKVQDVLTEAGVAPAGVPEKLLRKLTKFIGKQKEMIPEIWRAAVNNDATMIPTEKQLNEVLNAQGNPKDKEAKQKTASQILKSKDSKAIISLLTRVVNGKEKLNAKQLDMLKARIAELCDNANADETNN